MPNRRHDGTETRRERFVDDVMLTNRIQEQRSAPGEVVAVAEGSVVLRDVRCALVRLTRQQLMLVRNRMGLSRAP